MKRLQGKVALVTGARGGIGRAICQRFEKEGATVFAADLTSHGSSSQAHTQATASSAVHSVAVNTDEEEAGHFLAMDVANEQQVITAFDTVMAAQGRLDIVVNAAGIEIEKTIEDTSLEEWNRSFAVNVTGTFLVSKYALPLLRQAISASASAESDSVSTAGSNTTASIINFGSYDGFIADPGLAAYCASKGAVHALTKAMACDHGPEGIRVNAICPGYIDTPMLQGFFTGEGSGAGGATINSLQQAVRDIHPMRRYGTPDDVANLVNWLASDEARYASGQLWVLDGGLSAQVQQMKL